MSIKRYQGSIFEADGELFRTLAEARKRETAATIRTALEALGLASGPVLWGHVRYQAMLDAPEKCLAVLEEAVARLRALPNSEGEL